MNTKCTWSEKHSYSYRYVTEYKTNQERCCVSACPSHCCLPAPVWSGPTFLWGGASFSLGARLGRPCQLRSFLQYLAMLCSWGLQYQAYVRKDKMWYTAYITQKTNASLIWTIKKYQNDHLKSKCINKVAHTASSINSCYRHEFWIWLCWHPWHDSTCKT